MTRATQSARRSEARREFRERASNAVGGNVLVGYDPGTDDVFTPRARRSKPPRPGVWRVELQMDFVLRVWRVLLWRSGVWFGIGYGRGHDLANAVRRARFNAHQRMFDCGLRAAP